MGGAQLMKRIPRIKFPQRHPKPAGSESQKTAPLAGDSVQAFFSSSKASTTLGGKASEQPPRTPVCKEEIEAILVRRKFLRTGQATSILRMRTTLYD